MRRCWIRIPYLYSNYEEYKSNRLWFGLKALSEFFFHYHMGNGDFDKLAIFLHITQFFIKSGSGNPGMHHQGIITHVPGYIFSKNHQSPADSFALQII